MATSIAEKYLDDPVQAAQRMGALAELHQVHVNKLVEYGDWIHLKPGQRLSPRISVGERYLFVAEGQVGVIEQSGELEEQVPLKLVKGESPVPSGYIAHFFGGDVFSSGYLTLARGGGIDCVAIMDTMLLSVPKDMVARVGQLASSWLERVEVRIQRMRTRYHANKEGAGRHVQDFFLKQNYSIARTLKVIDLGRCIGCDGCERACASRHGVARLVRKGPSLARLGFPISCRTCTDHRCLPACGFDALTMKEAELSINAQQCVGCRACYEACPNSVITMVETPYTVDDFPKPMPATTLDGETNVDGLYLTGEASGAALIKVAINGGAKAIEHLAQDLAPNESPEGVLDVVIVGAGPAGLSASLAAMALGFEFKVFDKGHFATTIQTYPRHKVVMAEPAHIPKYGTLWLKDTTKEELIEKWAEIIDSTGLVINSNEPVTSVTKADDGVFDVITKKGAYRASRVVLATGTRGAPRKLGVPGEAEPRVQYALTDPEAFAGRRALVVGGGDSAVEAAMSLADAGATATLSYRRDAFGRIKVRNRERLASYESEGKVTVILKSTVREIEAGTVTLKVDDGDQTITNDVIFAMLGAEPPTKFFKAAGVEILEPKSEGMKALAESRGNRFYASKCDHCSGHEDRACIAACPTGAIFEVPPDRVFPSLEDGGALQHDATPFRTGISVDRPRRMARGAALAALVLATMVGIECFLRVALPELSLLGRYQDFFGVTEPVVFESGRGLGFWLGIVGTALMVLTALYPLHSRVRLLSGLRQTRWWLGAHIVAGIMGPLFVSYHTLLKLDRWPSIAFWLAWAVVFSGAVGRYAVPQAITVGRLRDFRAVTGRSLLGPILRRIARVGTAWRVLHILLTGLMFGVAILHVVIALLYRAEGA